MSVEYELCFVERPVLTTPINYSFMDEPQELETSTRYEPSQIEDAIYQSWEKSGLFTPPADGGRPTFTVMIPPPNVTGVLHMGHALNNTIQDIVIRHRRMLGFDALWVPGTDHAGIATQAVVEKKLLQETGKKRLDMGRAAFIDEIWEWRNVHGDVILEQLKKLGASCDWSRNKFTLDPEMSHAVRYAFKSLWDKGLVYRGARLVNWDCKLETAVSDDEIEYVTRKGFLYTIRYPLSGSEEFIEVATTRPETMFGDMGVAVHPRDPRYAKFIGKTLDLPLTNRQIPIVADESVDSEYGTGAVKVTPGHDPADYERGKRHQMPTLNILNPDGTLNSNCGDYAGKAREKAREEVLASLDKLELLIKTDEITHNVTVSDRSKTVIEPLVSEQWFVRMKEIAQPAINAVEQGDLKFKPSRWSKVYIDWLTNVHDWCISRQLWWGHRIPVWYDEDDVPLASVEDVEIGSLHPETGKKIVRQEEDVLDTWASSWLWPFSTLGWPDSVSTDLSRFYPTQFLSTGRDIIYLWVARMVMAGHSFLDHLPEKERCPFSTCYIHATVLDGQGRRMSKSAGNGIDPLEMIKEYGADAVRYSLMILTREGQDVKLSSNRFDLGRRFCNKIYNAARFAMLHLDEKELDVSNKSLAFEDKWILSRLQNLTKKVSKDLDEYNFHDAAQALYRFTTDDFCDWYLELVKRRFFVDEQNLSEADEASSLIARHTLGRVMSDLLKLLHPFVPFLTESLWADLPQRFREDKGLLMGSDWPQVNSSEIDCDVESQFDNIRDSVRAFRNVRSLLDLPARHEAEGVLHCDSLTDLKFLAENAEIIKYSARLKELQLAETGPAPIATGTDICHVGAVYLPMPIDADTVKLRNNLESKKKKLEGGLSGLEKKLSNEKFMANAEPEIVAHEKNRQLEMQKELKTVEANLKNI